jgi:hypothetical protein
MTLSSVRLYENGLEGPEDLVGDLAIRTKGGTLEKKAVYLDAWLATLIAGSERIQEGQTLSLEMLEEPDPLVFSLSAGALAISYQAQRVVFPTLDAFSTEIARSARGFLETLRRLGFGPTTDQLRQIERFVAKASLPDPSK